MKVLIFLGLVVAGFVVYQLVKAKKAVTVANVVAQATADEAAVKKDVPKV